MLRTLPLLLALACSCAGYPTQNPPADELDPVELTYWNEAATEIPAHLVGLWRPVEQTGDDIDWFVITDDGIYRRIRRGHVLLEEGGARVKRDVLFLHCQVYRGETSVAPNIFRFRFEKSSPDTVDLVFLAASERGDAEDDRYTPKVHRLVRVPDLRLPDGADEEWLAGLAD